MVKAGTWGKNPKQIHNFYSMKYFECPDDELNIKVGDCSLTETHMSGYSRVSEEEAREHPEYMSDAGDMMWDLDIDKKITFIHIHPPKVICYKVCFNYNKQVIVKLKKKRRKIDEFTFWISFL